MSVTLRIPPGDVHGFDAIAFDDYRIPKWMWERLEVCTDTGCWEVGNRLTGVNAPKIMAMKLLSVETTDIFGVTQTCANNKCCNPSHLCVTLKK